ncbi:ABC transporter ATP-binding protein, partial [Piscinibacter defluvii]|uniref:ABC transporter ATP-binding protein n=1 Tax=Piscinibacter defluvii TaxID=1796922 RepID=UPI0013E2F098
MLELRNLTKWYQTPFGRRYVFRDLSFKFPDNASIGLIGRNGAGKSTLLRLLGGIDSPNAGAVVTDARISWPVGLSGGFQNSLTARENLQFICRIHGATGPAMRRILDFVADFAEIGDYFDLPVSSYSSGMRARVAFGASMAFEFDYYLIDELMAVGDPQFRQKSQRLLRERLQRAKVIMVSHNTKEILRNCDVVVLVDRGNTVLFEDVRAGVQAYLKQAEPGRAAPEAVGARPAVGTARPPGARPAGALAARPAGAP